MIWRILHVPPLVELRPFVLDEVAAAWRDQEARILAPSMVSARAMTPVGSKLVQARGFGPTRVEWWGRPEVAGRWWGA